ncbi:type II secretion system F family protein [Schlegelella sp. S2-27]|uniref:Type II secretion system F family protein n=1 Tax=Caldimonas mangrovi TaxID=2944811 RepID=A0ABT0YSF5_9BURK|nr:type II secretion system F family protein [Caldimonas mangrovi]MCM5681568.1 type II secretion system F family protein [Caldimonas mangrovi]
MGHQPIGAVGLGISTKRPLRRRRAAPRLASDLFCEQLSSLLQAGIGPVEAIKALAQQAGSTSEGAVLQGILSDLQQGRTLAQALEHAERFDPLLVALVRASEETSDLTVALQRYLQHARQADAVRQRIITASVYPMLLLVVGGLVMLFLLTYVVPRFSGIFASIHTELPWSAQLLLQWGNLVKAHGAWMAAAAVVLAAFGIGACSSPRLRSRAVAAVLEQRHVGRYARLVYLARLYRTTGTLIEGGIPFVRAFGMASALLPHHLQATAASALRSVQEGTSASAALAAAGLATPVVERLLHVGQRSGEMGPMLVKAAAFHESETARAIERFMRALEPTVMAVMGLAIGAIVVVMYLPIFELASAIR